MPCHRLDLNLSNDMSLHRILFCGKISAATITYWVTCLSAQAAGSLTIQAASRPHATSSQATHSHGRAWGTGRSHPRSRFHSISRMTTARRAFSRRASDRSCFLTQRPPSPVTSSRLLRRCHPVPACRAPSQEKAETLNHALAARLARRGICRSSRWSRRCVSSGREQGLSSSAL